MVKRASQTRWPGLVQGMSSVLGTGASSPPEPSSPVLLCALPSGFQLVQPVGPGRRSGEGRRVTPGYSLPWHPPCLATAGGCALDQGPDVLSGGPVITASGFRSLRLLPHPHPGSGVLSVSLAPAPVPVVSLHLNLTLVSSLFTHLSSFLLGL